MEKRVLDQLQGSPGRNGISIVSLLQLIQQEYNYLPEEVLREAALATGFPLIEMFRVATFYKSFSLVPRGKHTITACCGTACHVRGSEKVVREISKTLGVAPGETTPDGQYTVETVNCLGACALAPLVVLDGQYYGGVTPAGVGKLIGGHRRHDYSCEAAGSK
ncbi:MAG: NAD(P)H-dependent oxidoreductase subunit E [Bacillota bacterium]